MTALRSLPESRDSRRSRALSSATMTRPRLRSDSSNGLLTARHPENGELAAVPDIGYGAENEGIDDNRGV